MKNKIDSDVGEHFPKDRRRDDDAGPRSDFLPTVPGQSEARPPTRSTLVPSASEFGVLAGRPSRRAFAPHRVLRLARWPEMRYVTPDQMPRYARICALLAVRPSVAYLVHKRLGLPREAVLPTLKELHDRGFLELAGDGFEEDIGGSATDGGDSSLLSVLDSQTSAHDTGPAAENAPSRWGRLSRRLRG